jgi:hypothetical protein
MYWLLIARSMAHGTILAGFGGGIILALMGNGGAWIPAGTALIASGLLGLIERELRR